MRKLGLVIGLVSLAFATSGLNACYPDDSGTAEKQPVACDGHCKVVIHLNDKCEPVDAAGNSKKKTSVKPNAWVCFVNDAGCTVRLTFPDGLFVSGGSGSTVSEVTLNNGECARLQVDRQAAHKTKVYTIACDCPAVPGGGSGNPEFNVGGGGGGGGGGGSGGGGGG